MFKILYIQDSHIKGKNPENRLGNYYQDVMTKIKEVIKIAKKNKVKYIIHGGDLYESELVSNVMVDEFIDLVEKAEIQWLILPGNHDEIGHSWELSKASSLAHIFRRSKYIEQLTNMGYTDAITSAEIEGFKYYHNIEQSLKEKGLISNFPTAKYKISIVHAMITLKPLPFECMHVVAKDIKTDFDVVLVAHNHHGWGIKEINGTKFVNIGCIGRRKIDEKDIKPSCLLIDTDTKELKIIELKSAKPAEEVFDLAKVTEQKEFEEDINNFIESLTNIKLEGLDIRGIVEMIGKEKKIEREVIDEVIRRLE